AGTGPADRVGRAPRRRSARHPGAPAPVGVARVTDLDVDVLVVGGGPGGSAAAVALARAGREVVVVDKATFPRDKICGDGLTSGALHHLEHIGVDPARVA